MAREYTIRTNKTWAQTTNELEATMRDWGVVDWNTNYPRGARWEGHRDQSAEDRTVTVRYVKDGKTVNLSMGKQKRAAENLRVLYLAIESMRMNDRRGIGDLVQEAYVQIAGPTTKRSPYEVLGIYPGSPLMVAEAAYKAMCLTAHPDRGGSEDQMKELNQAIQQLREEGK
jgi:hypothetical protein